jgi:hypothetical protein
MKKLLAMLLLFPAMNSYSQAKWEKNYDFVDNCICGLSRVKKDGKVGYVNKEGVVLIKVEYDEGLTFKEGYTAVRQGAKWRYMDSTGKAITDPIFDDAVSFSDGLAAVQKNNEYGFININGEVIIPFTFSNAHAFSENLAAVANAKGFWGYIDKKGNWIIKPIYDFADEFTNEEARVMKADKVLFIDKQNNVVHK